MVPGTGFVETIVFNTALMRRRIRDRHLVMKMLEVGESSRTDVALCYMEDRVDQELLKNLNYRIKDIKVDASSHESAKSGRVPV